ncbi:hypothetical protein CVT26_003683 [Gymnopilus dilepis]|uniref:Uncharacterized protein n=1 Tax=Gymnopilus dilepis TaxID=231916 RepID=A0A409WU75_9AGAR|nr:hypothetical protein CVT26_003683 [Gymnopilus dilepis]
MSRRANGGSDTIGIASIDFTTASESISTPGASSRSASTRRCLHQHIGSAIGPPGQVKTSYATSKHPRGPDNTPSTTVANNTAYAFTAQGPQARGSLSQGYYDNRASYVSPTAPSVLITTQRLRMTTQIKPQHSKNLRHKDRRAMIASPRSHTCRPQWEINVLVPGVR